MIYSIQGTLEGEFGLSHRMFYLPCINTVINTWVRKIHHVGCIAVSISTSTYYVARNKHSCTGNREIREKGKMNKINN